MSSESEGQISPKVCLACGLSGRTSPHFGGASCTACASFFRRTVSLNIRYVCKRENDCISCPELRSICRACRYESCVQKAGLNRELVQQRRSDTRIPKYILHSRKDANSEIVRDYTTNSYTTLHEYSQNAIETIESSGSEEENEQFSKILDCSHDTLLEQCVKRIQCAISSMSHNIFDVKSREDLLTVLDHHKESTMEECSLYPGSDLLEKEDLGVLFQYSLFANTWIDSAWISSVSNRCDQEDLHFEDTVLTEFLSHLKSSLCSTLSAMKLNVFEYAVLKSFCIWKLGVHDSSVSLKIVAQEHYIGVTSALRNYYESSTSLKPFETATRIAEITLQIGPMFGIYREMMRIYQLLGIVMPNPFLENQAVLSH